MTSLFITFLDYCLKVKVCYTLAFFYLALMIVGCPLKNSTYKLKGVLESFRKVTLNETGIREEKEG